MEDNNNNHKNGRGTSATVLEPKSLPETLPLKEAEQQTEPQGEQQKGGRAQSLRKRPTRILLAAVLGVGAIAGSVFGVRWWQYASTHEQTDNATVTGHVYQVSSRVAGTVARVLVNDNQEVRPGQLLVQLDPRDYQVKVQQVQAALAIAQRQAAAAQANITLAGQTTQGQTAEAQGNISNAIAAISSAQAAVTEAQAGVPAAQANLAETAANLQRAQADFNRYSTLYQSGAISQQQLDTARAAYQTARAQRDAAQQGVNQAQAKLAAAQQGVNEAQAKLAASRGGLQQAQAGTAQTEVNRRQYAATNSTISQAQANLAEAQLQLSYTNITAPEAGRVGRKTVEVGNRVTVGQPLMSIVGDDVWVVANFKETQVDHMRVGERVEVQLDAFPGHTFTGRVDSLSPASGAQFALLPPDNATGNFTKVVQRIPVKVVLDPDSARGYESQITPGMSAEVSVEVK
jgi:membrane fusion protein (multidrug efflux system)